jgi:hypothetical protein
MGKGFFSGSECSALFSPGGGPLGGKNQSRVENGLLTSPERYLNDRMGGNYTLGESGIVKLSTIIQSDLS